MNNINISFSPTQAHLDHIEEWLIEEDRQKPFSGFYCNWKNSILPAYHENRMVVISADGYPIGFQTWLTYERTSIIQIAEIKPGFRRQGYGRTLTGALIEHLQEQKIVAVKLHCQPPKAETAWKKMGFKRYPNVPDFSGYNNFEKGRTLYKILVDHAKPTKRELSGERIELWAVESYLSDRHPSTWKWPVKFKKGTQKLIKPIIIPAIHKWNINWQTEERTLKDSQIRYFSQGKIDFDTFLVIEELLVI